VTTAAVAKWSSQPTRSALSLRTTGTRPCSGARDARFAIAKEASPGSQPKRSVFVQSGSAARVVRGDRFATEAVVRAVQFRPGQGADPAALEQTRGRPARMARRPLRAHAPSARNRARWRALPKRQAMIEPVSPIRSQPPDGPLSLREIGNALGMATDYRHPQALEAPPARDSHRSRRKGLSGERQGNRRRRVHRQTRHRRGHFSTGHATASFHGRTAVNNERR
jgi:hypothetical protein